MAKLTRSALKSVVKECLLEILTEGIAPEPLSESLIKKSPPRPTRVKNKKAAALDQTRVNQKNQNLVESLSGTNSMMQDIFRDTLENTMAAQSSDAENSHLAQRATHGDAATKQMIEADPMNLFEGANNWAALAFSATDKL
ncbi:hypothetical protein CL634_06080 [bacterium]|nr:hypothetical protein [bacterium]